jgi:hypothetical protein
MCAVNPLSLEIFKEFQYGFLVVSCRQENVTKVDILRSNLDLSRIFSIYH